MQITGTALLPTEKENCTTFASQLIILEHQKMLVPCIWFHVANEGNVGPRYMEALKAMGLKPGASDYVFMAKHKNLCLEAKGWQKPKLKGGVYRVNKRTGRYYQRKGRLKKNQQEFGADCYRAGVPYEYFHDLCDAYKALDKHGFLPFGYKATAEFLSLSPLVEK